MGYYKGTMLTLGAKIVNSDMTLIIIREVHKKWESQIDDRLKTGMTIDEQKELYKEQLDLMEQVWFESEKLFDRNYKKREQYMVEKCCEIKGNNGSFKSLHKLWFMNIACLLKLKVINNDDMNGFLTIC